MPALALMYGHRMYSPEPTPTPARMTEGPSTLRSGSGSGMSRYSIGGRWSLRTSGAYCGPSPKRRPVGVRVPMAGEAKVLTSRCGRTESSPNGGTIHAIPNADCRSASADGR
jgi:hypothetical protein